MSKSMVIGPLAIVLLACGGGGSGGRAATATPSATTTPSPAPTATALVRYRLTEASNIISSQGGGVTVQEPLSGSFATAPADEVPPNTALALVLTNIEFQSAHFRLSGSFGTAYATTISIPVTARVTVAVSINTEAVDLSGTKPLSLDLRALWQDIELCGALGDQAATCEGIRAGTDVGYSITLFANPEG